jgi:hypothetical protein
MTRNDTHTLSDQDLSVHNPPNSCENPLPHEVSNPLQTLRTAQNLSRSQFAAKLKLSKTTVQYAELGCFSYPPLPYRPLLTPAQLLQYQTFRQQKRLSNFSSESCRGFKFDPKNWTEIQSLDELLDYLEITPYLLADLLCVTPNEVFRFATDQRNIRRRLPINVAEAFKQIGAPPEFYTNLFLNGQASADQLQLPLTPTLTP